VRERECLGNQDRSLTVATRKDRSLTVAARKDRSLTVAARKDRSLTVAARKDRSLTVAARMNPPAEKIEKRFSLRKSSLHTTDQNSARNQDPSLVATPVAVRLASNDIYHV